MTVAEFCEVLRMIDEPPAYAGEFQGMKLYIHRWMPENAILVSSKTGIGVAEQAADGMATIVKNLKSPEAEG